MTGEFKNTDNGWTLFQTLIDQIVAHTNSDTPAEVIVNTKKMVMRMFDFELIREPEMTNLMSLIDVRMEAK